MQKIFPRACERFDKICCARGENRRPMCDVTRGITELRRRAALTSQSLLFLSRLRTLYSRHSQNASRCESLRNFTSRRGTRRTCGTEREREREREHVNPEKASSAAAVTASPNDFSIRSVPRLSIDSCSIRALAYIYIN